MASKTKTFGAILREKRLDRGFGLREFATMVGVSSTYISQLEQENIDPPTAERASKMAEFRMTLRESSKASRSSFPL